MSQRIFIGFLGLGPKGGYKQTSYKLMGGDDFEPVPGCLFPIEAWLEWEKKHPDLIFILGTAESLEKYRVEIEERVKAKSFKGELKFDQVKMGGDELEIREIFAAFDSVIKSESSIQFDVTHGFRLQPIVGLIALQYLQAAKGCSIDRVTYASFDEQKSVQPVIDMSPYLELLSWAQAAKALKAHGDFGPLQKMRQERRLGFRRLGNEGRTNLIDKFETSIRELSDKLVRRPTCNAVAENAKRASLAIDELLGSSQEATFLRPLAEGMKEELSDLIKDDSDALSAAEWCCKKRFYLQALIFAREGGLSALFNLPGMPKPSSPRESEIIGDLIGKEIAKLRKSEDKHKEEIDLSIPDDIPLRFSDLFLRYGEVSNFRNQLMHGGVGRGETYAPPKEEKIAAAISALIDAVRGAKDACNG